MKSKKHVQIDNVGKNKMMESNQLEFPIVGIGASAGGLEALEQFFTNTPSDNGMAFIVIQHLDPSQPGFMPELLQRITKMKVTQASDHLKVKPNCIYVIPPNKSLSILNGYLHLFDAIESRGLRLPVDIFFKSLADDRQDKSIGIILSGMGTDGSLGLKALKEKKGITLVQDPIDAKFDGMPRSAMEAVNVDIVASAEELPVKLINFLNYNSSEKTDKVIDRKTKSALDKIIILLREQTGHDFSQYKKNTLFRRIERRKGIHQLTKMHSYVRFLQENPKEIDLLFKELLIGVTGFFRDTTVWEKLKQSILPDLFDEMPDGRVMRAWIPGCSTGEEAYSLAILFKEAMARLKKPKNLTLQIFATDIDNDAIEKARKGLFTSNISNDVNPERLSRYFTLEGDGYKINNTIREMVVFAPQNVIKDPPFTKLDFISCRNMLIYMEPELQKKLLLLFNYSLNLGGIMLLGNSETLGNIKHGFKELDPKLKIYKCLSNTSTTELSDFPSSFYYKKNQSASKNKPVKINENIQSITYNILLQRFTPVSVLVNEEGDIIYITGRTGKYLEPVAGKANWNIYAMAREGLRNELPSAFRQAQQDYKEVNLKNVKIETGGDPLFVDVIIQRIEAPESVRGMIILVFNDVIPVAETQNSKLKAGKSTSNAKQKEVELELKRTFEELQSTREEMQTSQEELKSTNEELQSTNEELQSTNEELTTSKEEMQSLNEELQTVNIELQSKVNDFVQANNDMINLLNSTEIATLFLDKELNIRRFTDPMTDIFKLRNTDIGRPFTDLVTDLQYPDIDTHARKVLKTLVSIEKAITTISGKWYNVRIMPYRTIDDRIDGLVITFNDITTYKKLEFELKEANAALSKNLNN
ncbi:chemotaxis protein CheB [Marinifilum flexuosum]|uniref:chemotaxis protein CheB n=1 Tax=Marinifilum flexuosum TaxID=1117708 RepID=UPI002491EAA1|nr:chemotaxis protein CheB [Marinifilum flexuosum]